MMVNDWDRRAADEKTHPGFGSALESAVLAVWRILFDLQLEWETSAAVVKERDPLAIMGAASALVAAWQLARNALEVIAGAVAAAQEHERRARLALRDHSQALQDLFRAALPHCEGTAAHDQLLQLIGELGTSREDDGQDRDPSRTSAGLAAR